MKQALFKLVEKGSHGSKLNLLFDYFIIFLIILNVIAIAFESTAIKSQDLILGLRVFEIVSLLIFTIEYLLRLYVADLIYPRDNRIKSILKFVFSPLGLIDLFAILPFYIPFIIPFDLRFIRLFRLFRFIRVFKITRYNKALNLIVTVFKEKKQELGITFFIAFIILIVASFLMYFIEGKAQPDKFPDVFSAMWWAVVTLTTIGYGDVFPITTLGKLLSGIIAVMGIGLIALPTGILSAGFVEILNKSKMEKNSSVCPHCGKEIDHS